MMGWKLPQRGQLGRREKETGGTGVTCRGNGNRLQVTSLSLGNRGLSLVIFWLFFFFDALNCFQKLCS